MEPQEVKMVHYVWMEEETEYVFKSSQRKIEKPSWKPTKHRLILLTFSHLLKLEDSGKDKNWRELQLPKG